MTLPRLDRSKFPAYVAPTGEALPQMRTLRSLRMITEDPKISYEQLLAKKHSTRMELADRILPDLLRAAAGHRCRRACSRSGTATTDVDSRGAVLFQLFVDRYFSAGKRRDGRQASRQIRPRTAARLRSWPCRSASAAAALVGGRRRVPQAVRRARREMGRRVSLRERERRSPRQWRSGRLRAVPHHRVFAARGEQVLRSERRDHRLCRRVRAHAARAVPARIRQRDAAGLAAPRRSAAADGAEKAVACPP